MAPRLKRADQGQRQRAAIEAIKAFEKKQTDWDAHELAEACGISVQHARNVMLALTFNGTLEFQDGVVVKKRRLMLSEAAKSPSRAA